MQQLESDHGSEDLCVCGAALERLECVSAYLSLQSPVNFKLDKLTSMVSAVGDNIDVAIGLGQLLERPESSELTNGGTRESKPALRETLRPVYAHVCLRGKAEDDRTKGQQPGE